MVRRMMALAEMNWQMVIFWLGLIAGVASFTIQLGSNQTHISINTSRIDLLEAENRTVERELAKLTASQPEQDRRLSTIEQHDIETRSLETKIMERLSKLEK